MNKPVLLVVDDNPVNQKVVSALAERYGYVVVVVKSGREALDVLESREEPFHAILMDLNMPIMNGLECTKLIRELETSKNWRTPIIGVSAHTSDSCSRLCLAGGMDDYLSKPFDSSHFQSTLAHWTSGTNRPALRVLPNAPDSEENRESASA